MPINRVVMSHINRTTSVLATGDAARLLGPCTAARYRYSESTAAVHVSRGYVYLLLPRCLQLPAWRRCCIGLVGAPSARKTKTRATGRMARSGWFSFRIRFATSIAGLGTAVVSETSRCFAARALTAGAILKALHKLPQVVLARPSAVYLKSATAPADQKSNWVRIDSSTKDKVVQQPKLVSEHATLGRYLSVGLIESTSAPSSQRGDMDDSGDDTPQRAAVLRVSARTRRSRGFDDDSNDNSDGGGGGDGGGRGGGGGSGGGSDVIVVDNGNDDDDDHHHHDDDDDDDDDPMSAQKKIKNVQHGGGSGAGGTREGDKKRRRECLLLSTSRQGVCQHQR